MTLFASGTMESLRHLMMLAVMVVLFLLLLPIIIPLVAFLHWRNDARMRRIAAEMHCKRCGQPMGPKAPKLADHAWNREADTIRKQPSIRQRQRVLRSVHAICPNCGLRYRFLEDYGKFVPEVR